MKCGRVREDETGVLVLGLKVGADVGGQAGRVAHYLAPVIILEPRKWILLLVAVSLPPDRPERRGRKNRRVERHRDYTQRSQPLGSGLAPLCSAVSASR